MILILTQCFPSRFGGIESLVSNLALSLSKSEKIIVFADRHHMFYDAIYDNNHKDEILVRRISGLKFFRQRRKIKEIKPFIESQKVKLIIADTWKSLELGIDYFNTKNIPSICLAHGNELLSNDLKKAQRIKNTLNKSTAVVANSLYTKKLVQELVKSTIIVDYVYPGANDLRNHKEHSLKEVNGEPVILTLARLEKRKGHTHIIHCIKKLLSDFPNIQYVIAGEGPEKRALQKLVNDKNLQNNVLFVGLVNDEQKKFLFERSSLMVMPTLDESKSRSIEGFGISYLEAAFFGIPSIASDVGGTPEAVINNSTGVIINSIDKLYQSMHDLLVDENKRILFGENAQRRSHENFQWNTVTKKYKSIFDKVVNNS